MVDRIPCSIWYSEEVLEGATNDGDNLTVWVVKSEKVGEEIVICP